jgi:N-acetylglucosaminyl-diphospho-decaprenol L-rhamnosyltransferase
LVQGEKVIEVDQVMGACLAVRKSAFDAFNPKFFLYCEDTELCYRLSKQGKIAYVFDSVFAHELGSSSQASRWKAVARYNLGKETFFKIHCGVWTSFCCLLLNRIGAILRIVAGLFMSLLSLLRLRPAWSEKLAIFWRVLLARKSEIIPADYIPE